MKMAGLHETGQVGQSVWFSLEPRFFQSIVAVPDWAELDAGVRTTASATPFAAITPLAHPIVAMPATRPALACAMVAVDLDKTGTQAIGELADSHWGGARHRGCCCQKGRRSQSFERSCHFYSHSGPAQSAHPCVDELLALQGVPLNRCCLGQAAG